MTNFDPQFKALVKQETAGKAGDADPGTGSNIVNYGGMEGPDSLDLHTAAAGEVPYTFEEANPQLQYTRPEPELTPVPVQTQLAPRSTTRSFTLTAPVAQPVQLLAKNPRRVKVQLIQTAMTTAQMWVSNDPFALASGQGMPLVTGQWVEWNSYGELYVSLLPVGGAVGSGTVSVVEYSSI